MLQILNPKEYYKKFMNEHIRPDGRQFLESRKVSSQSQSISTSNGSCTLRQGQTVVVCGIKAEVAIPIATAPRSGFIVCNVDLPPLCSPLFKPGIPHELTQTTSEYISQFLKKEWDLEQLCIKEGKAVWTIYIDLTCLHYDGNILDISFKAIYEAFKNLTLPNVDYHEVDGTVRIIQDVKEAKQFQSLIPTSFTFGIIEKFVFYFVKIKYLYKIVN